MDAMGVVQVSNYWHLVLFDGEEVKVKPSNVAFVKERMTRKENIVSDNRVIVVTNVKDFVETDIPYIERQLGQGDIAEGAARAFNEVVLTPEGSAVTRWVKKWVTRRRFESYYSPHGTYKKLEESDNQVLIAFKVPAHLVNPGVTEMCTPQEVRRVL